MPPDESGTSKVIHALESFLTTAGYLALFLLTVAQCCGFPVSSEVVLPFAGVLTVTGTLNLPLVIVVALIGELVGALIAYWLADWVGRAAIVGFGQRFRLKESHFEAAERFYERRGVAAVAVGRVLPVLRSYTSYPAGFARMPLRLFIPATLVGAFVWDAALSIAGMELGKHFNQIGSVIKPLEYAVLALVVVALLYGVWRYINRPLPTSESVPDEDVR
ncbi:MAG: DedA family protein [Candidatus Dormibacteraeota bacterium]|nr:DedA family protein [Candidatus Dormibacteraeota bacterium]